MLFHVIALDHGGWGFGFPRDTRVSGKEGKGQKNNGDGRFHRGLRVQSDWFLPSDIPRRHRKNQIRTHDAILFVEIPR